MTARNTIFISFARGSSEDAEPKRTLDGLLRHLEELIAREPGLALFVDEKHLGVGRKWHDDIAEAMRRTCVVVLLITPELIRQSGYVRSHELPEFWPAGERGDLIIVPVFVLPTSLEPFTIPTTSGSPVEVDLASLTGGNRPKDDWAAAWEGVEREQRMLALSEQIRNLARDYRRDDGDHRRQDGIAQHRRLDVILRPRAGGVEAEYRVNGRAFTTKLQSTPTDDPGQLAWQRVFGNDAIFSRVLALAGDPTTTPHDVQFETLIECPPAAPHAPWGDTAYEGSRLHSAGWTFAWRNPAATPGAVALKPRFHLLIATCDYSRGRTHAHIAAAFRTLGDGRGAAPEVHIATGSDDLLALISGYQPQVVYLLLGSGGAKHPFSASGEPCTLAQIAAHWKHAPPALLFVNVVTGGDPIGRDLVADLHAVAADVPLVVAQPIDVREKGWSKTTLSILDALVMEPSVDDPVWIVQEEAYPHTHVFWPGGRWLTPERTTTHERRWRVIARLLCDRVIQRNDAKGQIDNAIESGRRTLALFGQGSNGNVVEALGSQIEIHLRRDPERPIRRRSIVLDRYHSMNVDDIAATVREQLGAEEHEDLADALARQAPRSAGSATSILLLDFGARGTSGSPLPLKDSEFGQWVEYCRSSLTVAVPRQVLVVCLLGSQRSEGAAGMEPYVHQLEARTSSKHFRLHALPELDRVRPAELKDYLIEAGFPFDDTVLERATDRLWQESERGRFDTLVRLLDATQADNWVGFDPAAGS